MYLARFDAGGELLLQALVRVHFEPADRETWSRWNESYSAAMRRLADFDSVIHARRIEVSSEGVLTATHLILCSQGQESFFRRVLGTLTRIESLIKGSLEFPIDRSTFDAWASNFPPLQSQVRMPLLQGRGAWLACDFRAHRHLGTLLRDAMALNWRFAWQINLKPFTARRDQLLHARINAERVADMAGAPRSLVTLQRRLSERLDRAVALCEEFVGVDSEGGARWLESELRRAFDGAYAASGLDAPEMSFQDRRFQEIIENGPYPDEGADLGLDELCGAFVEVEERSSLLAWSPDPSLPLVRRTNIEAGAEHGLAALSVAACPDEMEEGFVFISYAHADALHVAPITEELQKLGVRVWYDAHIVGGSEWDAKIEEQIEKSALLILLLSQRAVDSRYVRREVKYADVLAKPVLSLRLEEVSLRHGLGMLLGTYQVLDTRDYRFSMSFRQAVLSAPKLRSVRSGL